MTGTCNNSCNPDKNPINYQYYCPYFLQRRRLGLMVVPQMISGRPRPKSRQPNPAFTWLCHRGSQAPPEPSASVFSPTLFYHTFSNVKFCPSFSVHKTITTSVMHTFIKFYRISVRLMNMSHHTRYRASVSSLALSLPSPFLTISFQNYSKTSKLSWRSIFPSFETLTWVVVLSRIYHLSVCNKQ